MVEHTPSEPDMIEVRLPDSRLLHSVWDVVYLYHGQYFIHCSFALLRRSPLFALLVKENCG